MLIEKLVLEYLQRKLDMPEVYVQLPDTIPDKFVIFSIVGRGKANQIDAVTMEFESYGASKFDAAELDESVRAAMEMIGDEEDVSCRFGGGNDNPDTVLKKHRYRSYFNLYF